MKGLPDGVSIEVPEGWGATAFYSRLVAAGVCRFESLVAEPMAGGMTVRQAFDLHRMLDWRDYCEAVVLEKGKRNAGS